TETQTQVITFTDTITPTLSITFTHTISNTITFTWSDTFTRTITETYTNTPSATPTKTNTATHTITSTVTFSFTRTITMTATNTPTFSATPTITITWTPFYTPTICYEIFNIVKEKIYPNPVRVGENIFILYDFINFTDLEIIIYTLDGRVALKKEEKNLYGFGKIVLNLKNIAPGIYFYQIIKTSGNKTEKYKIQKLIIN
ncbi:MAG: T9SS type A sorting domain-containing protein, partial [Candidatus Goldbacteria bacterium]|nr:T9SS type A sorting domain-containing protein [Candidatus Goldiibacteriota bacterium]